MREVTGSLAVRLGEVSEQGFLHIYLPTEVPSGCWAHFNGPFYGDMSRTHVDFGKPFNEFVLRCIAERALEVVDISLKGKGTDEGRAILDLLSPRDKEAGTRWWSLVSSIYEASDIEIQGEKLILTDKGWKALNQTSVVPSIKEPKVLTEQNFRLCASFPIFSQALSSRQQELGAMFEAVKIDIAPLKDQLVLTLEMVAQRLQSQKRPNWNGFWQDVMQLFPNDSEALKGKKVLLGTDGELHASGEGTSVFLTPGWRRGRG